MDFNYFNCYIINIYWKMFEKAKTGYLHFLTTGYNNSVMSCDGISIDQFSLLFSSLSMRLLVFHLEYHCIVLWLMRLTNCLKMGWSLCPKRHENTWFSQKIKISCTFLQFTGVLNDLIHFKSFIINLLLALFNSKLLI